MQSCADADTGQSFYLMFTSEVISMTNHGCMMVPGGLVKCFGNYQSTLISTCSNLG